MSAIIELMEEAKKKAHLPSDYALAQEIGVRKQTISAAKKGRTTFGTYSRQRLADLTGRDIKEINALIEIETETDPAKQEYWRNFYRTIGGMAASFSIVALLAPIGAAIEQVQCILYKIANTRKRAIFSN